MHSPTPHTSASNTPNTTPADSIIAYRTTPHPRATLLCLPYAGGAPTTYRGWTALLPPDIDLWAAQPPGRGARMSEPAPHTLSGSVLDIADALSSRLDRPVALLGHSMGALLAFETARELRRRHLPAPVHLFLCAHPAPHLPPNQPTVHDLPDTDFLDRIRSLGGSPPEVLADAELTEVFLPLLRADFAAVETHQHQPEPPLRTPITAIGGDNDPFVNPAQLQAWRNHTVGRFTVHAIPGDHFFIRTAAPQVLSAVFRELNTSLR